MPAQKAASKMSDLREEFGFIPPELLYKCDGFVRAFHKGRGSGKDFVAASAMFSSESPFLRRQEQNAVAIWKLSNFLLAVSVIGFIISVLTSWWLLVVVVPMSASTLYLYWLMKSPLIQQRAIILAVEALATDFAGWGQLFPVARSRAEAMFARDAGDWPKLVDLYLPRERRTDADVIRMFAPSDGSIKSALLLPVSFALELLPDEPVERGNVVSHDDIHRS